MDYDKTNMAAGYDAGRGYSPAALAYWLGVIAPWAPRRPDLRFLDLGCGTGRYSEGLAERFNAEVVAIDPSETMLAEARKKATGRVRYERASGESLSLPDGSIDVVFMSMVFHHFADPARALRECRRILRNGGTVCLRAATSDQIESYPHARFFPKSIAIMRETLQSRETIMSRFAQEGFALKHHELARSEVGANWSVYVEKIGHRADSVLVQLSDREFAAGMALLRKHAASRPADEPVIEFIDFFVFEPGEKRHVQG